VVCNIARVFTQSENGRSSRHAVDCDKAYLRTYTHTYFCKRNNNIRICKSAVECCSLRNGFYCILLMCCCFNYFLCVSVCYSIVGSGAFCCWIGLDKFAPNMMELLVFARFAPRPNQAVKKNRSTTSIECIISFATERERERERGRGHDRKSKRHKDNERKRERESVRARVREKEREREREGEGVCEREKEKGVARACVRVSEL